MCCSRLFLNRLSLLLCRQYPTHHQDSIISYSQTDLRNITLVSILKCHPQASQSPSGFPHQLVLLWVSIPKSRRFHPPVAWKLTHSANSQEVLSILAPSCFVNDLLKLCRSHFMSFLVNSPSNISPYLISCIAALLDLWIASLRIQRLKDGGNVKLSCMT